MGAGKPAGSLATHPMDRDQILHHAWDLITQGNVSDCHQAAQAFLEKYAQYIPKFLEFHVNDITVASFKLSCQAALKSAAGLDGWMLGSSPALELSSPGLKALTSLVAPLTSSNVLIKSIASCCKV